MIPFSWRHSSFHRRSFSDRCAGLGNAIALSASSSEIEPCLNCFFIFEHFFVLSFLLFNKKFRKCGGCWWIINKYGSRKLYACTINGRFQQVEPDRSRVFEKVSFFGSCFNKNRFPCQRIIAGQITCSYVGRNISVVKYKMNSDNTQEDSRRHQFFIVYSSP